MSDESPDILIAVVGEEVGLHVVSDESLAGTVTVRFTRSEKTVLGGSAAPKTVTVDFWTETLTATPLPDDPSGKKRSEILWTVQLNTSKVIEDVSIITFEVAGTTGKGAEVVAHSTNLVRVPPLLVTKEPLALRIMLHEWPASDGAGGFVVDRAQLQTVITTLSREQRKFLATYDPRGRADRFVVFVTFVGEGPPMQADNCFIGGVALQVFANATFTVFHCRGPGEPVTLVCHTRHFTVNMVNPHTRDLFEKKAAAVSPSALEFKRFVIGGMVANRTDGVVWHRVFKPDGNDVMPGNTIHGMLNTIGCWMLFRNYNWPFASARDFLRVMFHNRRGAKGATVQSELDSLGYDAAAAPGLSSSFDKFVAYDQNYAYALFCHDLLGIEFFSRTWLDKNGLRASNVHNPHGLVFEKRFPLGDVLPGEFLYHDIKMRRLEAPGFQASDALWRPNALGFQTAQGFVSEALWKEPIGPAQAEARSWADLYFFKHDDVSTAEMLRVTMGPPP